SYYKDVCFRSIGQKNSTKREQEYVLLGYRRFYYKKYIFAANMSFLYPNFLWALLALAIPIIIHLFYFRRFKRVYFTNVELLKEVKEETSTRNRLKDLLILLARLLALA